MRVKMLKTRRGASNGFTIKRYDQGEEYELSDSLALNFISQGVAKAATIGGEHFPTDKAKAQSKSKIKSKTKTKAITRAPENKGAVPRA